MTLGIAQVPVLFSCVNRILGKWQRLSVLPVAKSIEFLLAEGKYMPSTPADDRGLVLRKGGCYAESRYRFRRYPQQTSTVHVFHRFLPINKIFERSQMAMLAEVRSSQTLRNSVIGNNPERSPASS